MIRAGHIPANWRAILDLVQETDKFAIIAGGCLRDLDHKKEVKDLDILVSAGVDDKALANAFDSDITDEQDSFSDSYVAKSYRLDASQFELKIPLNIIRCSEEIKRPIERVGYFDLGLCQVAFEGGAHNVHYGPAYSNDYYGKCFTVTRCPNPSSLSNTLKRWQRLVKKYPTHPLTIPARFAGTVWETTEEYEARTRDPKKPKAKGK